MSLREQLAGDVDVLGVFTPVDPDVLRRMPDGFAYALAGPEARTGLRRSLGGGRWGRLRTRERRELDALVRRATVEYPAGLSVAELATATVDRGYDVLPISISISGDVLAMMLPHALFDGQAAWRLFEAAAAFAVGEPLPRVDETPERFPVVRALRNSGLDTPRALLERFRESRAATAATAPAPLPGEPIGIDRDRRRAGYVVVPLAPDEVKAIETQPIEGRATRGMRLVALGLEAFAEAAPPDLDYRIRTMIDARRYLPRGSIVDGAFSVGYPIGTLRGTDNSAGALTTRLAGIISSKAPVATIAGDLASALKHRVTGVLRRGPAPVGLDSLEVGVSILPTRMPEKIWLRPDGRVSATIHFHAHVPSHPFLQVTEVGDAVSIGLWDETGTIDQRRFAEAVHELASAGIPTLVERA